MLLRAISFERALKLEAWRLQNGARRVAAIVVVDRDPAED